MRAWHLKKDFYNRHLKQLPILLHQAAAEIPRDTVHMLLLYKTFSSPGHFLSQPSSVTPQIDVHPVHKGSQKSSNSFPL